MIWTDLRVGFGCNNACKFCDQAETGDATTEVISTTMAALPHRDGVILAGGEVTLRPDLPGLLATARRLGFRRVAIQSNGRVLAARGAAAHLRAQGLTDAIVAVHADRADVHDWLVSVDGAWRQATAGAKAAAASGINTRLATVLTRSNLAALAGLPALAARLGATGLRFIVAREEGRAGENARMIVPRLSLAAETLAPVLDAALGLRLDAEVVGVPLCLLPRHRAMAADRLDSSPVHHAFAIGEPSTRARVYAAPCGLCALRHACAGLDAAYVARHGDGELPAAPPQATLLVTRDAPGRVLKQALVRARRLGATRVKLEGDTEHPEWQNLLREAARLGLEP